MRAEGDFQLIDFQIGDELELVRNTALNYADDHLRPALRENESARTPGRALGAA